ncbi:glycosyltransferase [Puniceicoccus vermicola]|nr:glycosyltransferase [Puniceicoccus vermicola]
MPPDDNSAGAMARPDSFDVPEKELPVRRVLILTSSTGGGHDMRARALKSWSETEEGRKFGLSVEIHQALEDTHGLYGFGVNLYNRIQQFWPKLHHIYFNFLEHASLHDSAEKIWGRHRFIERVREVQPDLIVSTHAHLNHGFFELAKWALPGRRIKCVTYCGELSGGYGFSRHWVNPKADLFIGAVEETCDAASTFGLHDDRNWLGGFMLDPSFYQEPSTDEERAQYLRDEFDFDADRFVLVLGTGANGANNHIRALNSLYEARVYPQVVALCGRKSETVEEILAWQKEHPLLPVRPIPYYRQMSCLLSAASAVVARSGTGTTSEAILSRCPLIFNGIGGVMPQECITVKFCRKNGIGILLPRTHQLPAIIREWMQEPEKREIVVNSMDRVRPKRHPLDILGKLRSLVE